MRHVLKLGSRMQLPLVLAFSLLGASFADSVAADGPHIATASNIDAGRVQANLEHLSGIGCVYLTLPPSSTYTTTDGWEWMGVLSPLCGA